MRGLFTDGWNSFAHFMFGVMGTIFWTPFIVTGFVLYELIGNKNCFECYLPPLLEFSIGFFSANLV